MNSEERAAWLAGLKVGDEVGITGYAYSRDEIGTIERLTPEQFVLSNRQGKYRKSDGRMIGAASPYSYPRIVPVDDEIRAETDRRRFRSMLRKLEQNSEAIPITTVRKLLAVLAEAEQEGKEKE